MSSTAIFVTSLIIQIIILVAIFYVLFMVARERKTIKKVFQAFMSMVMSPGDQNS